MEFVFLFPQLQFKNIPYASICWNLSWICGYFCDMMKVDYYLLLQCDWHLITKKKHTSPSYFRFDIKPWIFLTLGFSADVSGLGSKTRTGWPGSGTVVETLKLKSSWHVLIDDLYTSWSINFQSFSVWNQISFFWSSFSCSRDWWVELSSHSPALGAFGYPPPDAAVYHALATRSAGLPGKTTPKWTVFFFCLFSVSQYFDDGSIIA